MKTLSIDDLEQLVIELHDRVLLDGQIPGLAKDKSLTSALSRPYNRILYGICNDAIEYSASICVAVAQAHAFNDANKRTALVVTDFMLRLNDYALECDQIELADMIVNIASGQRDEQEFADWLKSHCSQF